MSRTPTEFEHGGHTYRIKRLNAMEQWHLNRKVAPLIPPLVPAFMQIARDRATLDVLEGPKEEVEDKEAATEGGKEVGDKVKVDFNIESVAALLGPFADGIANMSVNDSEYIIDTCMSAISRHIQGSTWMPVWNGSNHMSTFDELNDLSNVLPMVTRVIWDALGTFINGLLMAQQGTGLRKAHKA